jgi:Fic family protein
VPEYVDLIWEGAGYGGRKDRRPFRYQAFIPDPIAEWDERLSPRAVEALGDAAAALRVVQGSAAQDLEVLAAPLLRAEVLGSSFIEGLRASNKRLALAAYEPAAAEPVARAVLGNVRAMERAVETGSRPEAFTLDAFLDIHRTLLEGTSEERYAGLIRNDQSWIGGRGLSPRDATFVPPPHRCVRPLLADLIDFVNRDDLPGVAQAALAHAQLETIHPFGDGNGRAGRCLIHVVLRRRQLTPVLVPPISVVLATNARRYIAGLVDHREGRYDDWLGYFADQVRIACEATVRLHAQITTLLNQLLERAGSPRSDSVARKIVLSLPSQPIVSAETVATRHGVTPTAARAALNRLDQVGVLGLTRVGRRRDREWASDELFHLLDAFEHDLGDAADGSSDRPRPPVTPRARQAASRQRATTSTEQST